MAHAKLNLSRMYDWIERNIDHDVAQPTDAQIMARFGFDSPESARTLLAELADAGRITITGYGETRKLFLGGRKSSITAAPRPLPAVKKADPILDAGVAKIGEIVARGKNAAATRAASMADALTSARSKATSAVSRPITPMPASRPAANKEPSPMPAKTIQLPASAVSAIEAIESLAGKNNITIGGAAALLIEQALVVDVATAPPLALADVSVSDLLAEIGHRLEEAEAAPDRTDEIAALEARAEAAEGALARIKAAFPA